MPDMGAVGVFIWSPSPFLLAGAFFETFGLGLAMLPRMTLNCCLLPKCVNEFAVLMK